MKCWSLYIYIYIYIYIIIQYTHVFSCVAYFGEGFQGAWLIKVSMSMSPCHCSHCPKQFHHFHTFWTFFNKVEANKTSHYSPQLFLGAMIFNEAQAWPNGQPREVTTPELSGMEVHPQKVHPWMAFSGKQISCIETETCQKEMGTYTPSMIWPARSHQFFHKIIQVFRQI